MDGSESAALDGLETRIASAMLVDRHRLRRALGRLREAERRQGPQPELAARLVEDLDASTARCNRRAQSVPKITCDEELPITARRTEIVEAIAGHPVLVVCGETGSGKSTQLPKFCLEAGRGVAGMIGHTQPRRIAARSVCSRIADELGTPVGRQVGFKIRFADATSPDTLIKLMTDGILLAETQSDRFLDQYDTLIIDEAHERSLNIDFLLGYIHRLLPRRPDLRLIITSATIDAERFATFFSRDGSPAPIISVEGRTFPIEVRYRPVESNDRAGEPDWQRAAVDAALELAAEDAGDMLLFAPTERDIRDLARLLRGSTFPRDSPGRTTEILPLYGRLSEKEQNRIFRPHPHRRIVIATNVAESSLTVPGTRFVIDPGLARIARYAPRSKVQRLPIEAISQASADQRKGRCGRVGPGVCVRLYSEGDFNDRERFTPPEILRTNLASVVLQTKVLGLGEIDRFPFLEPPKPAAVRAGFKALHELGALDEQDRLTEIGRRLGRLPVDPRIGRMVLAGTDENCLSEMLIIAAALEVRDPRERPLDKQQAADEAHAKFRDETSDFLTLLRMWDFLIHLVDTLSQSQLRKACAQNFLSYNRAREWRDLNRQLRETVIGAGLKPGKRRDLADVGPSVHRAVLAGFLSNVAVRGETSEYTGTDGQSLSLWPGSAAMAKKPKWIVAAEQVETSRRFARTVASVEPEWIEPLAAHLVNRSYSEPHWSGKSGCVMAYEKVSLYGLPIVPRRRCRYGAIDPVKSRELFIRHGLVEGDMQTSGSFREKNARLIEEINAWQAKLRQANLLLGEEAQVAFFQARIPQDVCDQPRFEKWRKPAERDNPQLLCFTRADLVADDVPQADATAFPDTLALGRLTLPLDYRLEPGAPGDGLTLTVPREAVGQLDSARLGWLVPGLLEEKVAALIKTLPKPLRRMFVPVPDAAREIVRHLAFGEGDLVASVAAVMRRLAGEHVPPEAFDIARLPDHLRFHLQLIDAAGEVVATGRDLAALQQAVAGAPAAPPIDAGDGRWRREGLTAWTFGELPADVEIVRNRVGVTMYPLLSDRGDSIALGLTDRQDMADRQTRRGLVRLLALEAAVSLEERVARVPGIEALAASAQAFPEGKRLRRDLADRIAERALVLAWTQPPRNAQDFRTLAQRVHECLDQSAQDVAVLVPTVMAAAVKVRQKVHASHAPALLPAMHDLRQQWLQLARPGFLATTPWEWLAHYPRYLQGMQQRLDRLTTGGVDQDRRQSLLIRKHVLRLADLSVHEKAGRPVTPAREQFRWLVEELRVATFARKLGTAMPIFDQRLDDAWAAVVRGE